MGKYRITRGEDGAVVAESVDTNVEPAQEGVFFDVKLYQNGCCTLFYQNQGMHICDLELFGAMVAEIVSIAKERFGENFFVGGQDG